MPTYLLHHPACVCGIDNLKEKLISLEQNVVDNKEAIKWTKDMLYHMGGCDARGDLPSTYCEECKDIEKRISHVLRNVTNLPLPIRKLISERGIESAGIAHTILGNHVRLKYVNKKINKKPYQFMGNIPYHDVQDTIYNAIGSSYGLSNDKTEDIIDTLNKRNDGIIYTIASYIIGQEYAIDSLEKRAM
jgi:hypothetical protein